MTEVDLDGKKYLWDGDNWCDPKTYMEPPEAIVNKLNAETAKIVAKPDVKDEWAKQGAVPLSRNPDEFAKYTAGDIEKWARIVKISGAKPDQ